MLRLFFALQPKAEQNIALTAQVAPLIVGAQAVRAENLHATLCFIGALEPEKLDGLRAAAATVRSRHVELRFDTLEHWDGPRVVCATTTEESESARALAVALGEAAIAAGFSPDIKPFRAHLTLARKVSRDLSVVFPQSLMPPTILRCDRFVLMESRRGESGSIYSAVDSWALYD
jgi:2'-5' RNA ligase